MKYKAYDIIYHSTGIFCLGLHKSFYRKQDMLYTVIIHKYTYILQRNKLL